MNDHWGAVRGELSNHLPPCQQLSIKDLQKKTNSLYLSVNIRGIRNNISILRELLEDFKRPTVKIITVSEAYEIDSNVTDNILDEYTLITKIRKDNPKRGGCGIFVHSSLQFEEININNSFVEGNFETLTISVPVLKSAFTSVYRPNGHHNACSKRFVEHLTNHIHSINNMPNIKKYTHYYMGDFNLDLNKPDFPITRDYIDSLVTSLYMPAIDCSTRITNSSSSCIDNIWCNNPSEIKTAFVIDDHQVADHLTIGIERDTAIFDSAKTIKKRIFSDENLLKFKTELSLADFSEVYTEPDTHSKWDRLTKIIKSKLEQTCPLKTINIKPGSQRKIIPYMTEGLRTSKETLIKLTRLSKRNPLQTLPGNQFNNWTTFYNYRKEHGKILRRAKRQYYCDAFNSIKHSPKKTWQMLNSFLKTKNKDTNIKEILVKGKLVNEDKDIANGFNAFYAGVGKMQAATVPPTETDPMAFLRGEPPDSMFLHPCSKEELLKAVKALAKKSSKGPDAIPCNVLFSNIEPITSPLTHCIDASFTSGVFPDCLKTALVVPLYKKKSRTECTNYRPVSLLNSLSKIIEKILYFRIYSYMGDKLCPNQFGFRPGHSTGDLMTFTLETIARFLNSTSNALPLFFDLGKAFDTLKKNLLIKKLEHYGIRGLPLALIKSYLSNRKQKVTINGVESDFLPLEIGVPQGSILGPLLFIIYVNDITTAAPSEKVALYADDTTCITGAMTVHETIKNAKTALDNLGNWFAANGLSLSPTKCKFALINDKLETAYQKTTLSIYGQNLSEVRKGTESHNNPLVGYLLNESLNNNEHINMIIAKMRSGIFALKSNKCLPAEALKSIYYATIHSHMAYAGTIVGCAPDSQIKPLLKLQKIALRIIGKLEYNAHTAPVCKKHNIMYVRDILDMQAAMQAWKFYNNKLPSSIASFFEKGNDRTKILKPTQFRNKRLQNISPIDYSVRIWNSLPLDIKESKTAKSLKRSFCKWKINSYT